MSGEVTKKPKVSKPKTPNFNVSDYDFSQEERTVDLYVTIKIQSSDWEYRACEYWFRYNLNFGHEGVRFSFPNIAISKYLFTQGVDRNMELVCNVKFHSDVQAVVTLILGGVEIENLQYTGHKAKFMYHQWTDNDVGYITPFKTESVDTKTPAYYLENTSFFAWLFPIVFSPFQWWKKREYHKQLKIFNEATITDAAAIIDKGQFKISDIIADQKREYVKDYMDKYYQSMHELQRGTSAKETEETTK